MAVTKLNYPFSCHLQTPHLPTKNLPPQFPLLSFKNPSTLSPKIQLLIPILPPKCLVKTTIKEERESPCSLSVIFPCLEFANTFYFNSRYNVEVIGNEKEPEEALIDRFRRQVSRAGVIRECKRRMFFENSQDKRKRKTRDAQRRYRKRRPPPNVSKQVKVPDASKKTNQDSDDDNWEFLDIELPYT